MARHEFTIGFDADLGTLDLKTDSPLPVVTILGILLLTAQRISAQAERAVTRPAVPAVSPGLSLLAGLAGLVGPAKPPG